MKKTILFATMLPMLIFGQNIKTSEKELEKTLCQKWKLEFEVHDGKLDANNPMLRNVYLSFKPDFTFTSTANGYTSKGKWCYNTENHNVELELHEENVLRISSINDEGLILVNKNQVNKQNNKLSNYTKYRLSK